MRPLAPPCPHLLPLLAWLAALVPSLPNLFIFKVEDMEKQECVSDFSGWSEASKKGYFSAVSLVIFAAPLLIMVILYTRILVRLRQCAREARTAQLQDIGEDGRETKRGRTNHTSMRANLPSGAHQDLTCRSTLKATNLSLTVVSLFVVTNLPYVVDEFIRQKILTDAWCDSGTFCRTVEAIIGMTIVSNSAINPFIFLLFNSRSPRAVGITRNCCPLVRGGLLSTTRSNDVRILYSRGSMRISHSGEQPISLRGSTKGSLRGSLRANIQETSRASMNELSPNGDRRLVREKDREG